MDINIWFYTIVSVFIVSLISLVGVFSLSIKIEKLKKILFILVSFAAGSLIGGAMIHLLPEAVDKLGFGLNVSLYFILGLLLFFILEKFVHWRHCHIPTSKRHPHPLAYTNMIGDTFHNFIDGLVIGASYIVSIPLGIATTVAVILHEIPQEIGDFGVMIHGGFSRTKALAFNFLSALTAVLGAIAILIAGPWLKDYVVFLLPITAGGFIYIASSDLIPEMQKEVDPRKSFIQLISLALGIAFMLVLV